MTLTTHAIVGASVAQLFPNQPLIGFLAGVASHYLSDKIPHWDYAQNFTSIKASNNGQLVVIDKIFFGPRFLLESLFVLGDTVLGLILAWLLWHNPSSGNFLLIILGAIGGMLPDYIQIIHGFWNTRFSIVFQKFHSFMHTPERLKIRKSPEGIFLQVLFVVFVVMVVSLFLP
jgi:hypothetical protein